MCIVLGTLIDAQFCIQPTLVWKSVYKCQCDTTDASTALIVYMCPFPDTYYFIFFFVYS
jgi:hypothetical protein